MNHSLIFRTAALILLLCSGLFLYSCGVRSPPLPPERSGRINATQLTATQRGSQIILNWKTPPVRRSSGKLIRIDIYRMSEQRTAGPTATTVDSFRDTASVVGFVPLSDVKADAGFSVADTI